MGWTLGIPSLKLNNVGNKSKHCGDFYRVAAEALEERLGHDPDINRELAEKNIYLGYRSAEELVAYSSEHCKGMTDKSGRSLRQDAVRMCATILKPPAAFMATLTEEEQLRFLNDGIDKLKEIVGEDNIKSLAYHFDEQGAHVHVFWEPMTEDGRLCAKELHGLKFYNRLNKEMPQHLRARGWDIDDCNAYDQAKAALMSEQEKAERRQKNGRSSSVFKADAERKLNEINMRIDYVIDTMEERIDRGLEQTLKNVANAQRDDYENAIFLVSACDQDRLFELGQEGQELKEELLQGIAGTVSPSDGLDKMINSINSGKKKTMSWEERNQLWGNYRTISNNFWWIRAKLKEDYQNAISEAYERRYDAMRSYYDAKYLLRRSRTFIGVFAALVWVCVATANQRKAEQAIQELKEERQKLIDNTATFKKFSNAYREELKAGKMPFESYLESMTTVVQNLDREEERFRRQDDPRLAAVRKLQEQWQKEDSGRR